MDPQNNAESAPDGGKNWTETDVDPCVGNDSEMVRARRKTQGRESPHHGTDVGMEGKNLAAMVYGRRNASRNQKRQADSRPARLDSSKHWYALGSSRRRQITVEVAEAQYGAAMGR